MTGDWRFDENVAARFQEIARTNIPHYEQVISKCITLASDMFPMRDARVIDVGSALGYTLARFEQAGFSDIWGVENSEAMIANSTRKERIILADQFPADYGPFDVVTANWTLHFVKDPDERKSYFSDIRRSLSSRGFVVLSDRLETDQISIDRYHDFKRSMGVSDADIDAKAKAIEGILVPMPLEWYVSSLKESGFSHVEIIDADWCFCTFLCRT